MSNPVEVTTKNTVSLTLGIIATVIGVLALLIGWVPFLGLFALPMGVIGIILAGVGCIVAMTKKGKGFGLPIVGGLICAGAIVLSIVSTGGTSAALSKAMEESRRKQSADAQVTVVPNNPQNAVAPADAAPPVAVAVPETPKVVWNSSENALQVGDIQIKIKSVKVGKIDLKDMFSDSKESADDLLAVTVEVFNLSKAKKIDFGTWRGDRVSFGANNVAALTDDNENTYKRISFGSSTKIVGGIDHESIYPGSSVTDVLVFEKPVDAAKFLHLELPAKNFKGEGVVRFEIPAASIVK